MNTGILKTNKKRSRRSKEFIGEKINREGQWTRAFDVRAESWFTFENWAHENHYHMIACKAHRRLYSRGTDPNYYTIFVDIRHDATRVVLSSWIEVGFKLRALSFFLLPKILPISPVGFRGIRTRRSACHHLNSILERFKQPAIHQSEGLHIADMEFSSLMLLGKMALAVVGFTTLLAGRIEVSPGLSNFLMNELFKRVMLLSVVGGLLFSIHHFGIARRTIESWKKMASAGTVSLVFTALAIFMLTKTNTEDLEAKVNHHCLLHLNVKKCAVALENLPEKTRENLLSRLQSFSKEIAIKK